MTKTHLGPLKDNDTIAIIGGGPAGSFFAHFALKLARKLEKKIKIYIFCGKDFIQKGPVGCKMCAGVLSETLLMKMEQEGIVLPKSRIQNEIDGYFFQSQERGVPLHHPVHGHTPRIVTVFRGNGPRDFQSASNISFDDFLLHHSASLGAKILSAFVEEIELPEVPQQLANIVYREAGIRKKMAVNLVVGAFGVNTVLTKRIVGKKYGYCEPRSIRTCNAELPLGRSFIESRFQKKIYVFSLGIKPIKFAAFTPKDDYVTVSLVGSKDITKEHLINFIKHPRICELLPEGWSLPKDLCICFPKIPISHAAHPYSDRFVIVGDASISRTYKNGIESSFETSRLAVSTAFYQGISGKDFKKGYYKPALQLLARDNFYGKLMFNIHNYITSKKRLVNAQIDYLCKHKDAWESERINAILWNMVTGNTGYREIFYHAIDFRLQAIMLPHNFRSVAKMMTDYFVNLIHPDSKRIAKHKETSGLEPLKDRNTVVIIGGGPAGASCGIALKNLAKKKNIRLNIILYEMKDFEGGIEHNECAGVLSQPIEHILEDELKTPFPWHLVKREIPGYYLHANGQTIKLEGEGELSYALRRIQFDAYLLQKAKEAGVEIIKSKVTDIELGREKVTIYSETRHTRADVVVGAFGLEEGTHKIFESDTPYKSPKYLLTLLTKFHPKGKYHDLEDTDGYIHAFLSSIKEIEFGAITPKADHYTINIAGAKISSKSMDNFLQQPEVTNLLPDNFIKDIDCLDYHRGCFPIKPAKYLFGDRYVIIGDAAGLIRPFKGKGVNAACLMGIKAAETMMNVGISKRAFQTSYFTGFNDVIKDLPYAKVVRHFVIWGAYYGFLGAVIQIAKNNPVLKKALFDSVSGRKSYRGILLDTFSFQLSLKILAAIIRCFISKITLRRSLS
ncbi:MAG: hypothetical protein FJ264_00400 [Planctomycetes bacterium]|nr:hypothetical protein [Planctomycetota bacterium]